MNKRTEAKGNGNHARQVDGLDFNTLDETIDILIFFKETIGAIIQRNETYTEDYLNRVSCGFELTFDMLIDHLTEIEKEYCKEGEA